MLRWTLTLSIAVVSLLIVSACIVTRPLNLQSNALAYLYPKGKTEPTLPGDVTLRLPVRVGLAFAPSVKDWQDPFTETQRQALLTRLADAFRKEESLRTIEVIPSNYLTPGSGFAELDQLAAALGIDLMVLVSYDQRQFSETTNKSWTYLTVVGAFAIKGEKNETRTVMDAVVYDIPSRALLFRAAGSSALKNSSTPVKVDRKLRLESEKGFELAMDDLIAGLGPALETFREQIKTGTVRGPGTPAIEVAQASVETTTGGAGAIGPLGLLAAALLVSLLGTRNTRSAS